MRRHSGSFYTIPVRPSLTLLCYLLRCCDCSHNSSLSARLFPPFIAKHKHMHRYWDKCTPNILKALVSYSNGILVTCLETLIVKCRFTGRTASMRFHSFPSFLHGKLFLGPETPLNKDRLAVKLKVQTFILMDFAMKSDSADHTAFLEILCLFLLYPLCPFSFLTSTMTSSLSFCSLNAVGIQKIPLTSLLLPIIYLMVPKMGLSAQRMLLRSRLR